MLTYNVTVPITYVLEARQICETLRDGIAVLKERLAEVNKVNQVRDGITAFERALEERKSILADIDNAKTEAVNTIKEKAGRYLQEVNQQIAMTGDKLASSPDYALLKDKLIADSLQLQMMAERNQDNFTMLVAIERYAQEQKWPGYNLATNAPSVKEFGGRWFQMAEDACWNPDGLAMLQITTASELRRMLNAYDVREYAELPEDEA